MKFIFDTFRMFIQNIKIRLAFIKADKVTFFVNIGIIVIFGGIFIIFIYSHTQDIYSIFEGIFMQKKEVILEPKLAVTISVPNEKYQAGSWFDWSSYSTKQKVIICLVGVTGVSILTGGVIYVLVTGTIPIIGEVIPNAGETISSIGETISSIGEAIPNAGETISVIGGTLSAFGATIPNAGEVLVDLDEFISNFEDEDKLAINTPYSYSSSGNGSVSGEDDLPLYPPYPYLPYSYPSSSSSDEEEDFSSLQESIFDLANTAEIEMFLDFMR
jgi:hypothetical protein